MQEVLLPKSRQVLTHYQSKGALSELFPIEITSHSIDSSFWIFYSVPYVLRHTNTLTYTMAVCACFGFCHIIQPLTRIPASNAASLKALY